MLNIASCAPQGNFSTKFQVPDVYGVFKFVIEYAEPGYNHVQLAKQIAVSPSLTCSTDDSCQTADSQSFQAECRSAC